MTGRTAQDKTLVDVATRQLRERIMSGEYTPGSPLTLSQLAQEFPMSVMPIREALQRLQAEGLVELVPHRGARVAPMSLADLKDLYSVRIVIEGKATREAALQFTDRDYEKLTGILDEYVHALDRGDSQEARQRHWAIHFGIYEVSGSQWALRMIQPLWEAAERYRRFSADLRQSIDERHREHQEILDYCRSHDAENAGRAMENHLSRSMRLVEEVIAVQGGRLDAAR